MKHVVKGAAPQAFDDWKALATDNWTPSYTDLQNPEKAVLHAALLVEQGHVCCYCGRRIALIDSHIEHFRPQEARPDLALDYENLLASCVRSPCIPLHCGHAKSNTFDETSYIAPLEAGCEYRFEYTPEGKIKSTDPTDAPAEYMLSLLELGIKSLNNRRKNVITSVFSDDFLASATHTELQSLRDAYRRRDEQGRLDNLGHVLARYAEQLLADMPPDTQP